MATPITPNTPLNTSVYGPVHSWRVGASLGVDLLLQNSICSFNCIYCQLGDIQVKTAQRAIYVPTEHVEKDFKHSPWQQADIVTFSGNGEPTLALNLAEVIHFVKEYSHKPVMVLTNGTLLHLPEVRADLKQADIVAVKLDAATEATLAQINRPVPGVTLANIVNGAQALRAEFSGKLALQCMFMPANVHEVQALAALAAQIGPDEIQLNTPKRPYPLSWHVSSRGNHDKAAVEARTLRVITLEQAQALEQQLRNLTGIEVSSVYQPV